MNLPNKLTVLRIIMVPFFVFFMLTDVGGTANKWIALVLFCVASLTDLLDGKIARKYNLVTNFGKFMDPLADKMLVTAAMLWFVEIGQMPGWALLVVIVREFAVSGLRMVASDKGRVIAAGWSGKVKTASTMVCIVLMFLPIPPAVGTACAFSRLAGLLRGEGSVRAFVLWGDLAVLLCLAALADGGLARRFLFGGAALLLTVFLCLRRTGPLPEVGLPAEEA